MKKLFYILLFISLYSYNAQATTYYSTSSGEWTDALWSTVSHSDLSGLVSLPCVFTGDDEVRMAHDIVSNCALFELGRLTGSTIVVLDNGAQLTVNGDLRMRGAHLTFIQPSSAMTIDGDLDMAGTAEIAVEGTLLITGNVDMIGSSKVCGNGTATYLGTLTVSGSAEWCSTLPIELVEFKGEIQPNNGVILQWTTSSETNNNFFSIERSYNGNDFEVIGKVDGAGNSLGLLKYTYTDKDAFINNRQSWGYYKLKQTDFDGTFTYSKTIVIANVDKNSSDDFLVYPNPANADGFYLNIKHPIESGTVAVHGLNGQMLLQQKINITTNNLFIDTKNLSQGLYMVVILSDDNVSTKQVFIK